MKSTSNEQRRQYLIDKGYRSVARVELSHSYDMIRRLIGPENTCRYETWMKPGSTTLSICTLIDGQLEMYTYSGSYLINWKPGANTI